MGIERASCTARGPPGARWETNHRRMAMPKKQVNSLPAYENVVAKSDHVLFRTCQQSAVVDVAALAHTSTGCLPTALGRTRPPKCCNNSQALAARASSPQTNSHSLQRTVEQCRLEAGATCLRQPAHQGRVSKKLHGEHAKGGDRHGGDLIRPLPNQLSSSAKGSVFK